MENKGLPRDSRWGENDEGKGFIRRWFELRFRVKITKQDRDLEMSLLQTRTISKDLNIRFQQRIRKTDVSATEEWNWTCFTIPKNVACLGSVWGPGWEQVRNSNALRNQKDYECKLCVFQKNWLKEELKHKTLLRPLYDFSEGLYFGIREYLHICQQSSSHSYITVFCRG